jgi:hypothetical protein
MGANALDPCFRSGAFSLRSNAQQRLQVNGHYSQPVKQVLPGL